MKGFNNICVYLCFLRDPQYVLWETWWVGAFALGGVIVLCSWARHFTLTVLSGKPIKNDYLLLFVLFCFVFFFVGGWGGEGVSFDGQASRSTGRISYSSRGSIKRF